MPRLDLAKARQLGYNDQQIQQYAQQKGVQLYDSSAQQPQQASQQSKPFSPLDLLPTVGGILGGVGGGALGGLLGGVGAPIGAVGGGALGSGAGEAFRQFLSGENNPKGVANEAGLGLVGGAAGEALGGAARIGAKLIGKGAGKALTKAGEGAIASQYNVPRNVARAIDFPAAPIQLTKYGITSLDQVPEVANKVTGQGGILSQAVRKAVSKAGPVPMGAYSLPQETAMGIQTIPAVEDLARTFTANPSISPNTEAKFNNYITKALRNITGEQGRGKANPGDVFELIQNLEKQAAGVTKGRAPTAITAEDQALSKAYHMVADELRDRLFTHAGADQQVLRGVLTPEMITELSNVSPTLAQEAMAAKNVGALRELQRPFVNANKAYDETVAGSQFGLKDVGQTGKALGKMIPSVTDPLAPIRAMASSNGVNAKVGGALIKAGQGGVPKGAGFALDTLSQSLGQGGTRLMQPSANQPQDQAQPIEGQIISPGGQDNMSGGLSDNEDQKLRAAFAAAILKSPKQAAAIKAAYDLISGGAGGQQGKLTADARNKLLSINQAENLINSLEGQAKEVGLGKGIESPLLGTLKGLAGRAQANPAAAAYESSREGLANVLSKSLGQAGNLSDKDIERAIKLIPALTDSQETAKRKIASLRSIIRSTQSYIQTSSFQRGPDQFSFPTGQ